METPSQTYSMQPRSLRSPKNLFSAHDDNCASSPRRARLCKLCALSHPLKHLQGVWKGVSSRAKQRPRGSNSSPGSPALDVTGPSSPGSSTGRSSTQPRSPSSSAPATPSSPSLCNSEVALPCIIISDGDTESAHFRPLKRQSRVMPFRGLEIPIELAWPRHSVSENAALAAVGSNDSPIIPSGPTIDPAARLQDFGRMIAEMRSKLFVHDPSKDVGGPGGCDNQDTDRLLRLLEDVMQKVRDLKEKDASFASSP
ncbi:hypothetical protein BC834DRAFT_520969 [Gloeopeniophorella convolvens]|nr:hypothetical protein BC834DRAFT_520969 [Gloeopeniophorella convolvens]